MADGQRILRGTSGNGEIETPIDLYRALDTMFLFDYDPFASIKNKKVHSPWQFFSTKDGTYQLHPPHPCTDPQCMRDGPAECPGYRLVSPKDGFEYPWAGKRVFCNPPYARGLINRAIEKMVAERNAAKIIVALLPADPSTKWWQTMEPYVHIEFLKKRVKYVHPNPPSWWSGGSFPSALAVFKKDLPL